MTDLLWFFVGGAIGGVAAWLIAAVRGRAAAQREALQQQQGALDLQRGLAAADSAAAGLREQLAAREVDTRRLQSELDAERIARTTAQTRLEEQLKHVDEQRRLLGEAEKKFREAFTALSADTLRANSEQFLKQADERVKPLRESLERYEKHVKEMEQARQAAYAGLHTGLKQNQETHDLLRKETSQLVQALRAPQARGQWGEMTLQRVVEVAGMSSLCDFDQQVTTDTTSGRQRPDLIVRMPGGRSVVVDSKTPLHAFLDAAASDDPEVRRVKLTEHSRSVRKHVDDLSGKAYGAASADRPEFVVLFLPGEALFSAAVLHDATLIDYAASQGVVLASPTTLIALLRAVAYGWQQHRMADNAVRVAEAARELFDRVVTFTQHFERIGEGLKKSSDAYNQAVRSFESRVAPQGRRLAELGAVAEEKQLEAPDIVDAELHAPP